MSDINTCDNIVENAMQKHVNEYHTEKKNDPAWHEVVLHEDRKEFLRQEASYCQGSEGKFHRLPEGDEKEEIRKIVLARRKEFLEIWRKTRTCREDYGNVEI